MISPTTNDNTLAAGTTPSATVHAIHDLNEVSQVHTLDVARRHEY